MQTLKVDRTKLRTPKSYAKMIGKTVQQVYNLMNDKKVVVVEIDGVKFIQL
jgi:hypothetical protein